MAKGEGIDADMISFIVAVDENNCVVGVICA
jgi:hypothetical protein